MTYVSMKDYGENTYCLTVGKTDVDWVKDELGNLNWNDVYEKYIPTWSFSALLKLIEWDYNLEKTLFDQSDYFTYSIVCKDLDFRTYEYDDPIDAVFEMICWLKENNKL